jgi:hypothetical protein
MGGEDPYLEGWDHERPVAGAATPSSEWMEPVCAVDLGTPAPGARFNFVGNLI